MVKDLLPRAFANCPGIWIEDKGAIVAIHYREAEDGIQVDVEHFLRGIVDRFEDRMRICGGKHVWEIVPRELEDKGAAVRRELASLSCRAVPVYVGDDVADEPAFAVLDTAFNRGVTVRVGRRAPTRAHYGLANVAQVRMFLEKLRAEFI
jgi:trehalose 6-phosphate phosphatase